MKENEIKSISENPTAEWYQHEKDVISLRSSQRPKHFTTININFRQTKFPDQVN